MLSYLFVLELTRGHRWALAITTQLIIIYDMAYHGSKQGDKVSLGLVTYIVQRLPAGAELKITLCVNIIECVHA